MSLSISPFNQPQQANQLPACFLPPTARPAVGVTTGQLFAQPFLGNAPQLLNRCVPNPSLVSIQSMFGMMQQVMASVERVVSMLTNLVGSLFGGAQANAAGQTAGMPSIAINNANSAEAGVATPAPAEKKPSTLENILNIGSTIMSVVGMFTGGGAGGILGSLGGLFKGGAGKIMDVVKKGISLFT